MSDRQVGYSEEMELYRLSPEKYFAAAHQAAAQLGWHPVSFGNSSVTYKTGDDYYFTGELVTITMQDKKVILHSVAGNSHSDDESKNRQNAELYKQAVAEIATAAEKAERSVHPMHREKYGALLPSKTYLITPLIVYINTLLFIVMMIGGISPLNPTAEGLFEWGGNFRAAVIEGEWWRLLSYMFLHAGALHLLMNTYALLYIGMFLEPLLGRFRFSSAYLLTGVCAGLMSIAMHGSSVGVGASGAIFGMYGVFLSVLTTSHIEKSMRRTMLRSILFFVVFNLLYGLQGNIDNAAHIGGLLSGLLIGYVYYPGMARHASLSRQIVTTVVSASFVVMLVVLVLERL